MTLTAIRVFAVVLRLVQKVLRGIHSENQNHKRPNRHDRGYPSPPPGVLQTFRNRVRVARAERARMVCHVRYESALEGLIRASSGITFHYPIVCADTVMNWDGMVHLRCIG